jgi:hypothetical protein
VGLEKSPDRSQDSIFHARKYAFGVFGLAGIPKHEWAELRMERAHSDFRMKINGNDPPERRGEVIHHPSRLTEFHNFSFMGDPGEFVGSGAVGLVAHLHEKVRPCHDEGGGA